MAVFCVFLCLLLGAGPLLLVSPAGAQEAGRPQGPYAALPETYRKGVDLAVDKLNSHRGINHHFLFFKTLTQSDIPSGFDVTYVYHNFYVKATNCTRGTADASNCVFRNGRPLIDCTVCYKTFAGEVEVRPKPYVNCIHKPALTEVMKTDRMNHCNQMGYSSGAPTLLASSSG